MPCLPTHAYIVRVTEYKARRGLLAIPRAFVQYDNAVAYAEEALPQISPEQVVVLGLNAGPGEALCRRYDCVVGAVSVWIERLDVDDDLAGRD